MKTTADYSEESNPWHAWITENSPEFGEFIRYAAKVERLNEDNRGLPWLLAIPKWLENSELDTEKALDAWISYCKFRAELIEYRTPTIKAGN